MKSLDKLKEEKNAVKRENQPGHWIQQKAEIGVAQEKQMEVCDVCGAFLIVNDVQQRVEDHLMGKQHVGFGRLKTALDELVEKRAQEGTKAAPLESRSSSSTAAGGDQERGQRPKDSSDQRGHKPAHSTRPDRTFRDHRNSRGSSSDHKSNNHSNNHKRHRSRSPSSSNGNNSHNGNKSHRRSDDRKKRHHDASRPKWWLISRLWPFLLFQTSCTNVPSLSPESGYRPSPL